MNKTILLLVISVIVLYISCGNRVGVATQNTVTLPALEAENSIIKPLDNFPVLGEISTEIELLEDLPLVKEVTARNGLIKREHPTTSSRAIGVLLYGARIIAHERGAERETIGEITNFWYRCQGETLDGEHYWVFGGFLSTATMCFNPRFDQPWEIFSLIDTYTGNAFSFSTLQTIFDMYPETVFKGEREYRNERLFRFAEYQYDGIVFVISGFAPSPMDAVVQILEISSSRFSSNRGIVVGNTKNDVFIKYGVPNFIRNNSYFYWNGENDFLELRFDFNEEGVITLIRLAVSI